MRYLKATKEINFIGPKAERKNKDKIDEWISNNQETCVFCAESLLVKDYKDFVKDHCHMTGKYRGAAHNDCNLKLRIKPRLYLYQVYFTT